MLQSDESDSDGEKHYNILLSPEEIKKLEIIISGVKEKFSK